VSGLEGSSCSWLVAGGQADGTTVTWLNGDSVPHTTTEDGSFDTGTIDAGASTEVTFDTLGAFACVCAFRPKVTGTVVT
jgi:plastocyanin